MRWAQITVQCAPEAQDAVSYAFLEAGCGGVMLRGNGPITIEGSLPILDDLMPRLESLRTHLARLEEFGLPALIGEMTLRYAEDEDWANAWRQYYKPMRVGKRLIIKPSWETYEPAQDELVLELDPGMAFGTGGHPTTRLCLQALEDHLTPGARVADIGTGRGKTSHATG
jgi:ribosomal protein L11 methyltransferase